jgi:hypothetical protein
MVCGVRRSKRSAQWSVWSAVTFSFTKKRLPLLASQINLRRSKRVSQQILTEFNQLYNHRDPIRPGWAFIWQTERRRFCQDLLTDPFAPVVPLPIAPKTVRSGLPTNKMQRTYFLKGLTGYFGALSRMLSSSMTDHRKRRTIFWRLDWKCGGKVLGLFNLTGSL